MSTATRVARAQPEASAGRARGAAAAGGTARPLQSSAIDGSVIVALRRLAALDRRPGGEGEAAAARLLRAELEDRGARAWIEEVRVHGTYWVPLGLLSGTAALAGLGNRRTALVAGALAGALAADELELGARPLRRLLRRRAACNVIAEPSRAAGPETLVIHAHHDAAPTGLVFDPALGRALARIAGPLIERERLTPPPWTVLLGPALVAFGGGLGRAWLRRLGSGLATASAMANVAASRSVPGANDNLSGVGVLLQLADELVRRPPRKLRVLLLSTGSEESFPEAMVSFGRRHFQRLDPQRTTFLCLEDVGSPTLTLLCAEGLLRARRYPREPAAVLAELAAEAGVRLHEGCRLRLATDGQVPLRAGYRTAVLSSSYASMTPSNHHRQSDTIGHVELDTMGGAARLAIALVRHLDSR